METAPNPLTAAVTPRAAVVLAALTGFIALAYELLWARLINFASGSSPAGFPAMLGCYLIGLALGSLLSQRWERLNTLAGTERWRVLSRLIVGSNTAAFLVVPLAAWLAVDFAWTQLVPLVALGAALLGTLLPLICHLAIPADARAGARMSRIYLANILGAGAGSFLTGFVLLDRFPAWQVGAGLLAGGGLLGAGLALARRAARGADVALWGAAAALVAAAPWLHDGMYERLQLKSAYRPGLRFPTVIEGRHGVITVDAERKIYGSAVYDGIIETKPTPDNGLVRPYFVSALHPRPEEVLVIGVSGGAWTQILAHHPQVRRVTAVEINHDYLEAIRRYPQVAGVLTNAKVTIHIDDGRRWLRRNPNTRFDVIVMNTTVHWREFASALLSREFLELARGHLKPGGFITWNCTDSARAIRTGMTVFPHTVMIGNFCAGSLTPLAPDRERWAASLRDYRIEGRPVFDAATAAGRAELEALLGFLGAPEGTRWRFADQREMERKYADAEIITDDNLGDEYHPLFGSLPAGATKR
jgi:spermidine synthase